MNVLLGKTPLPQVALFQLIGTINLNIAGCPKDDLKIKKCSMNHAMTKL